MSKKYLGVVFDLDGTLLDSLGVWSEIDEVFLGNRGFDVPEDYQMKISGMSYEETAKYTIERFGLQETPQDLMKEWFEMAVDAYTNHVKLKTGVKEYLEKLKAQGIKMCIATASGLELVNPALKNNGVDEYFDNITTLAEVSRGKGYPDIYELAARKMGLTPAECIVFEDIALGIQGAKAGGFKTAGVFDVKSMKEQEALKKVADAYVEDYRTCEFPPKGI